MNSLYGVQIRKDINDFHKCKSQQWMATEYDDNILAYWRLPIGNFTVIFKKDDGLGGDNNVKFTLPSHLGAFIFSNARRIMNNFIREVNGFYKNIINYGDTDSL